jgi:segregation and condensation protein B
MDYFGINSPEDLPRLKEVFDESIVNPTIMNELAVKTEDEAESNGERETHEAPKEGQEEEPTLMIVREDGELIEEGSDNGEKRFGTESGGEEQS